MNLDRTWCASTEHNADCDRQITPAVSAAMDRCHKTYISMAYFCKKPEQIGKNSYE